MKLAEAVERSCAEPTLSKALTWIAVWETERVVAQALEWKRTGVSTAAPGQGWDTCFERCFEEVLRAFPKEKAPMTDAELMDALDGLHAYDSGSIDSGIKDELLRERVTKELSEKDSKARHKVIAKYVIDSCLSDSALEKGYGPEDAKNFLMWLDNEMGLLL